MCRRFIGGIQRSYQNSDTYWVLDSGSSYHITGNKCWFQRLKEIDTKKQLEFSIASGRMFCPTHEGAVRTEHIKLSGVYFIDGCSMNIISVGILESQGLQIDFGDGSFSVLNPETSKTVGKGYLDTESMKYVVSYLDFKKKLDSKDGSATETETAEGSIIMTQESSLEDTQSELNRKRKREEPEVQCLSYCSTASVLNIKLINNN